MMAATHKRSHRIERERHTPSLMYAVRGGKLNLRGVEDDSSQAKKRKKSSSSSHSKKKKDLPDKDEDDGEQDFVQHGGWWKAQQFHEINGNVAIEFGTNSYVHSLDNGLFCVGSTRPFGEGPEQQQILTAIRISDNKVAFKSGFGKYLAINKNGLVIGRSDAIGMREHFEPVFENGNLALSASNDKFIRFNDEGDLVALDDSATEANYIQMRSNAKRVQEKDKRQKELPVEEQGSMQETEVNYVRKFQKFQDKKLRVHQGDVKELVEAKNAGLLHEALLDRREKMKSDRYCK